MKIGCKMRIAQEQNVLHRGMYVISVIVLTAMLCSIPLLAVFSQLGKYRVDNLSKGIKGSYRQVGSVFWSGGTEEKPTFDFTKCDGLAGYGLLTGQTHTYIEEDTFPEIYAGSASWKERPELDYNGGIVPQVISDTMWDAIEVDVAEGHRPAGYEKTTGQMVTTLVYYGWDWPEKLPIGTVRDEVYLIYTHRYVVAGYLSKGSCIPSYDIDGMTLYGDWDTSINLDNQILYVEAYEPGEGEFFIIGHDEVKGTIERRLIDAFGEYTKVQWLEEGYAEYAAMARDYTKIFLELTLVIAGVGMILIAITQIIGILSDSEVYGIWYSCGISTGDLIAILFMQNLRRMFLPLGLNILIGLRLLCMSGFGKGMLPSQVGMRVFFLWMLPIFLLVVVGFAVVTTIIPAIVLIRKTPIQLLQNDV